MDAPILGADAFGILVKNFTEQQAAVLQGTLRIEGVETEIVDHSHLPALPPAKVVNRLECLPQHLLVYDPVGRSFPVAWPHVMLIAAGWVRITEFVRERRETVSARSAGDYRLKPVTDYTSREETDFRCRAEIILSSGVMRFSIDAEKFNFGYLGDRKTPDSAQNFTRLIQDTVQFSTNAGRNRGAEAIRVQSDQMFLYPSKNAFHEEIVWMLWQIKKSS